MLLLCDLDGAYSLTHGRSDSNLQATRNLLDLVVVRVPRSSDVARNHRPEHHAQSTTVEAVRIEVVLR